MKGRSTMEELDHEDSLGRVQIVREDETAIIHAVGEFDLRNSPALWTAIASVLGVSTLLVDLSNVTFIDSSCLSVFVRAAAAQDEQGLRFELQNPSTNATRVLAVSGLDVLVSDTEMPPV
jgi:anti-anti-sigma factor